MSKEDGETPNEIKQSDGGADITPFPIRSNDPEDEESEYLVDIETHSAILVVARNVEEAAAKALTGDGDTQQVVVSHDVHVCVHSGISANECDHEEEAE